MTIDKNINSQPYWDMRFSTDWESLDGPTQSREFSWLAINQLPEWLLRAIRQDALTVVDWGCAQGDGTDVWTSYLPAANLYGVDFSITAIQQASEKYPAIHFECDNWLAPSSDSHRLYDIVFSSNTLEHFPDPYTVLQQLAKRAKKAIVLLLPYKEIKRIEEHEYTFLPQNIPAKLDNNFSLIWVKISGPHEVWTGEQALLIYAQDQWIQEKKLTLSEIFIDKNNSDQLQSDLLMWIDKTAAIEQQLAEANAIIADSKEMLEATKAESANYLEQLRKYESIVRTAAYEIEQANGVLQQYKSQNADLQNNVSSRDINISQLHKELNNLRSSASWRITLPVRALYRVISKLATPVFLKMPTRLQRFILHRLNPSAHPLAPMPTKLNPLAASKVRSQNDIPWEKFARDILSQRSEYKGVFIQEVVIGWNVPLYQRPQHIAAAMGRLGYLVIYRIADWMEDNVNGFREVEKNVWITNCEEVDSINDVIRSVYSTAYAISIDDIKKNSSRGNTLYEYIDHIDPEISGNENIKSLISLKNFAFSGGVDYVVASAQKLYDEAAAAVGIDKTIMVQNGVDTRHYRHPQHKEQVLPALLTDFKKRFKHIVGYFGALAPWLWYETITDLVKQRSDIGFVFIGPDYYGGMDRLPKAENIIYLGAIDYKILPAYGMSFDVCFIPFKPGDIAKTTSPLKLFEYFALEKPVVVTSDMAECTCYPEVFHGATTKELSEAIDKAIVAKDDAAFKKRLSQLADENSWEMRAMSLIAGLKNKVHE